MTGHADAWKQTPAWLRTAAIAGHILAIHGVVLSVVMLLAGHGSRGP